VISHVAMQQEVERMTSDLNGSTLPGDEAETLGMSAETTRCRTHK